MSTAQGYVPPEVLYTRLIRSRNWHLKQAGVARQRHARIDAEVLAHERAAAEIDAHLRTLALTRPDGGGAA